MPLLITGHITAPLSFQPNEKDTLTLSNTHTIYTSIRYEQAYPVTTATSNQQQYHECYNQQIGKWLFLHSVYVHNKHHKRHVAMKQQ
jgi:hypothetical protein